jgi:hypothetical protein
MALIQISAPIDMHALSTWYGNVAAADASHIQIVNGSLVGTYSGSFSYDASGNVYGTLTGFSETMSGLPMFSVTGLNMSAYNAEQLIQSKQIPALLQAALAGNDQFTLQPGIHVVDGYGGYNTVRQLHVRARK